MEVSLSGFVQLSGLHLQEGDVLQGNRFHVGVLLCAGQGQGLVQVFIGYGGFVQQHVNQPHVVVEQEFLVFFVRRAFHYHFLQVVDG